jgi:hypothetical protein
MGLENYANTETDKHTHKHTHSHTNTHSHTHSHTNTHSHTQSHTHTYSHTHTQTHTHTHDAFWTSSHLTGGSQALLLKNTFYIYTYVESIVERKCHKVYFRNKNCFVCGRCLRRKGLNIENIKPEEQKQLCSKWYCCREFNDAGSESSLFSVGVWQFVILQKENLE